MNQTPQNGKPQEAAASAPAKARSRRPAPKEAAEAGYRLLEQDDFVKADGMDYFLVFAPR